MTQRRTDILRIVLTPIIEMILIFGAFWATYYLRGITDGIPFIQLRIPEIRPEQFTPFVLTGMILWLVIFARAKLYTISYHIPLFEEIRRVILYASLWFFIYIGFVYLTTGFLFSKEIPRLIIIYTYILGTVFSIIFRAILNTLWGTIYSNKRIRKTRVLCIVSDTEKNYLLEGDTKAYAPIMHRLEEYPAIEELIRQKSIDIILLTEGDFSHIDARKILTLAGIYGIPCMYPKIQSHTQNLSRHDTFLAGMPVIELNTVSITPWQRVTKRIVDIVLSFVSIVILLPLMIIIYIGIKIEDPSGPAIFRNRRIGQDGKEFTLYKFRYMYWRYCVKEAYIQEGETDDGLLYEEQLKKKNNSREGPLYKIQNDPRKMRFGACIERLSLDEIPQLFNVLRGNMSLVGPRPHQPREVELYDESDRQVLTIKPGITGMAQVAGRDKNRFKDEIALDIYYIENYSIILDIAILLRTIFVVLKRPFEKHSP